MVLIAAKLFYINRISFDLDSLSGQLDPIKKCIKANTVVGYKGSKSEETLYGPVSYIMVPQIVVQNFEKDTLIMIQDKADSIATPPGNYRVLSQNVDGNRVVSLICKNK
jgi:hypothetical protein